MSTFERGIVKQTYAHASSTRRDVSKCHTLLCSNMAHYTHVLYAFYYTHSRIESSCVVLLFLAHIKRDWFLAKIYGFHIFDSDAVMCANQHVVGAGCWPSSGECPFCRTPSMPPFPQPCRFIRSQVSGLRFKCQCCTRHVQL